nr:immunoglobulin light chain junction region [Macaca mulatta]
CQQYNSQPWTF